MHQKGDDKPERFLVKRIRSLNYSFITMWHAHCCDKLNEKTLHLLVVPKKGDLKMMTSKKVSVKKTETLPLPFVIGIVIACSICAQVLAHTG